MPEALWYAGPPPTAPSASAGLGVTGERLTVQLGKLAPRGKKTPWRSRHGLRGENWASALTGGDPQSNHQSDSGQRNEYPEYVSRYRRVTEGPTVLPANAALKTASTQVASHLLGHHVAVDRCAGFGGSTIAEVRSVECRKLSWR